MIKRYQLYIGLRLLKKIILHYSVIIIVFRCELCEIKIRFCFAWVVLPHPHYILYHNKPHNSEMYTTMELLPCVFSSTITTIVIYIFLLALSQEECLETCNYGGLYYQVM